MVYILRYNLEVRIAYLTVPHMAWCISKQTDKHTFIYLFICSTFDGSVKSSDTERRTDSE